jgi:hypothetical protein
VVEKPDFTGLRAMYINCTLNRSPDRSHTQGVIDRSVAIMEANGVDVDQIRAVDHDIATGPENDLPNRNIAFMTYNPHLASMIRGAGGIPAHGNQRTAWDAGSHPDNANPEYR